VPLIDQLLHDLRLLLVLVLEGVDVVLHLADFVEGNLDVLALEGLDALGEGEQFVSVFGEFGPLRRLLRVEVGVDENTGQWLHHVEVSLQNAETEAKGTVLDRA